MASLITTLKDATKTNELLPRTRIKAVYDDNGNALSSSLTASDINALANGGLAAKADKVTSPTNGDIAKLNASGNLVDSGIPATKVVQNDGYYKNLGAGTAEQLISTVFTEDKVPYNFRTAGGAIDIGDREEDEIEGGSIAWNSLVNTLTTGTSVVGGVTVNVESTSFTINSGTASSSEAISLMADIPIAKGHKFLLFGCFAQLYVNNQWYENYGDTDAPTWDSGGVYTAGETGGIRIQCYIRSGTTYTTKKYVPKLYDLTAMFGSQIADYINTLETGEAGAGVAWFRKYFPKPYYAYNAGSLESVCVSEHNTTGFNQWDEEWEVGGLYQGQNYTDNSEIRSKNYIPILPETTYYLTMGAGNGVYFSFYDANKNWLSPQTFKNKSNTITSPASACYMRFFTSGYGTTYNHDICINLHWDGERDGEYEPYVKNSYALDHTKVLRGIPKLDANNKLYYDGDVYKSDGTVIRRYGVVDLGTLNWYYVDAYPGVFYSDSDIGAKKKTGKTVLCGLYESVDNVDSAYLASLNADKTICGYSDPSYQEPRVYIKDSSFTSVGSASDPTSFLGHLQGVMMNYELATPTEEQADPYTNPQIVDDFGTEEYVDYPESQGTRDVAIPVGHNTKYQPNLRAKLEMAPDSPDGDGYYAVHQDDGENEYVEISTVPVISGLTTRVPACSTGTDGTFVLKATVADGAVTYAWVEEA